MLKGQKVSLRAMEREDMPRLHEMRGNIELEILAGGDWTPYSFARTEKWFEKHLEDNDPSWFVIEVDGKVIGDMGLHHQSRQDQCTSFGIGIRDPEYVGKGYGREAMRLFLDFVFRIKGWRRVWLETGGTNARAIRMYKAVGFTEEGRFREHAWSNGKYEDVVIMGLLKTEWDALQQANTQP